MPQNDLSNEWVLLQNQYDSYEKYSLVIKLFATLVFYCSHISDTFSWVVLLLLIVFWLQDAIWKTFQSRIELRLLALEEALADSQVGQNKSFVAYQFNSDFQAKRPSQAGLIKEYLSQALRPTVAFPYIVLVGVFFASFI